MAVAVVVCVCELRWGREAGGTWCCGGGGAGRQAGTRAQHRVGSEAACLLLAAMRASRAAWRIQRCAPQRLMSPTASPRFVWNPAGC